MKAHLMYPDADFDPARPLPAHAATLAADLGLDALVAAMAAGDKLIAEVARAALLGTTDADVDLVRYRQAVLDDCLVSPRIVREIYALAGEAVAAERRQGWHWADTPSALVSRSRNLLDDFMGLLTRIKALAADNAERFRSPGFRQFFAMLERELSPVYLAEVRTELERLKFGDGVLISATLGPGNHGVGHRLRRWPHDRSLLERLIGRQVPGLGFEIAPRDEAGWRAREALEARGLSFIADAVAQSADHVRDFFTLLQRELAFYIGGLNLRDALAERGLRFVMPEPAEPAALRLSAGGLYDISLGLATDGKVVANDIAADGRHLIVVTGANRGGKTTFLRSLGLAQLMLQAGLFVPAAAYAASLADHILSHFRAEEDAEMRSGKLDEELVRMDGLAAVASRRSLFLFNESFAATNEREGARIAAEIATALVDRGLRVAFVTHLHSFAQAMFDKRRDDGVFLRADRPDGAAPFKLELGAPMATSFGRELFADIVGET